MARLIYSAICSLDGYVEDTNGEFGWARPDEQVHAAVNAAERAIGTYVYGRRMYETMRFWETADTTDASPAERAYAELWRAADKVVYSRTLDQVSTERTRLERDFDPAAVAALLASADRDVSIGGATIAGTALAAGLVDECHFFVVPVAVGGGLPAFQPTGLVNLDLLDHQAFENGTLLLSYRVAGNTTRSAK